MSHNLFAYCLNNPVNRVDFNGEWSLLATIGAAVGVTLVAAAVTVLTLGVGTATLAGAVAVGAAKGALVGAAAGTAIGAGVGYATTGTLSGAVTGAALGAVVGGTLNGVNYTAASNFLKSNGANPQEILGTYKGVPKVQTLQSDTTVYRSWGGESGKFGHWVSPNNYGSNVRSMLSLPPGNTTANLSTFSLEKGTTVLSGKVAPYFGQPGGGIQWWVPHLR